MTIKKIAISLIATSVLFTACGGGGGDSTTVAPPPPAEDFGKFKIEPSATYDVIASKTTYITILTGDDYIDTSNGQSFYDYKVVNKGTASFAKFDAKDYGSLKYTNSGNTDTVKISITDSRNGKTIEQDLTFNVVAESAADEIKVLKTGQAEGDSGETRNFTRGTEDADDVIDTVNGLTWDDDNSQYGHLAMLDKSFTAAKTQCVDDGGRLPSVEELYTTLTYQSGRYQSGDPAKNMLDDVFKARQTYFWADNGKAINYTTGQLTTGEAARFRCIKGGDISAAKHLMYTEGSITHDLSTSLAWSTSKEKLTFGQAKTYCDGLDISGVSGWQLPTINQLRSITNNGLISGAILNGNASLLSSTEVVAQELPYHLYLLPTDGRSNYKVETAGKADSHAITCVRKDQ